MTVCEKSDCPYNLQGACQADWKVMEITSEGVFYCATAMQLDRNANVKRSHSFDTPILAEIGKK